MAETKVSLQQTHQSNPILKSLFHALDPISLILNQNSSDSYHPVPLRLTTQSSYLMERGPRYEAYAELRETKLRMKYLGQQEPEELVEPKQLTAPRKQVKLRTSLASERKGFSVLAQSMADFSATLRKENRKPLNTLPPMQEMTPPAKSFSSANGVSSNSRGSKSANAGEKRGGRVLTARKSYASIDELKSLSSVTANAINGEGRGGRPNGSRMIGKTALVYRQF